MSDPIEATGSCLCGCVTLSVKKMSLQVGACHCSMCRKWGGGPLLAVDCGTEVAITGEEQVRVFDSSDWAERGFCSACGTHLFYRLKQTGQHIVSAGLFDDPPELDFDHQVFIDEKPGYYAFSNETKDLTGAEVFAMFSGES